MAEASVKELMLKAIERLPDDATLEDVAHLVRMHERLARARRESAAGLGVTVDEARRRFGIVRQDIFGSTIKNKCSILPEWFAAPTPTPPAPAE